MKDKTTLNKIKDKATKIKSIAVNTLKGSSLTFILTDIKFSNNNSKNKEEKTDKKKEKKAIRQSEPQ